MMRLYITTQSVTLDITPYAAQNAKDAWQAGRLVQEVSEIEDGDKELANMSWKLYQGDCLETMQQLPSESVDLVLTDPPYNASNSNLDCYDKHYHTIDEEWDKGFRIEPFVAEAVRLLKPAGSMLVFCTNHLLGEYLTKVPIKLQDVLHWAKSNPFPAIAKVYTPSVEYICWFVKGSPYTFNKRHAGQNIIKTSICAGNERTEHPSQKPVILMERLLRVHSNKGDTVLDPFAGSGTTGLAAEQLERNCTMIEKDPRYCEIIRKRLSTVQQQLFA